MLPSRANNEYAINDDDYGETEEQQELQLIDDKNENSDDGLISPKKKKKPKDKLPVCYGIRRWCGCLISREKRRISLNGRTSPGRFMSNKLQNNKYNIITFVPVVLFNQFKFFYNLFFLLISLSQFVPPLKVGYLFTYISPLVFVLLITMCKEAFDDIQRWRKDKEANNKKYEYLHADGNWYMKRAQNMRVGDIIKVNQNENVPCDCVLLHATEKSGTVFLRTDQLDGETDWKLRKAVGLTNNLSPITQLKRRDDLIMYANPPNDQIYDFKGYLTNGVDEETAQKEALSLENTLWQNTVLASSGYVVAIVIFTGKETRAEMNSKPGESKVGKIDLEINRLSKLLCLFMAGMAAGIVALNGFKGQWYIDFFRFVLLLSAIIPISLRVNLDLAKVFYSYCIYRDDEMPGTIPRNSTIPEELGRIQFLMTDKTGTLTQNDMIFKKMSMEWAQFDLDSLGELQQLLEENCANGVGPMHDMEINPATGQAVFVADESSSQQKGRRKVRREQQNVARDTITALALCHNVTPTYPDPTDPTVREF
jgi:phospholipid-translocating ATPase